MKNIEEFAQLEDHGRKLFPNLAKILMAIQSLPFELNKKANCYLTISDNTEIAYHRDPLLFTATDFGYKFLIFYCPSSPLVFKGDIEVAKGSLVLLDRQKVKGKVVV